MKKIIILTSVLFLSTILAAVLYFSNLSVKTRNNDKVLAQIPAETALIFQFKNDKSFNEIFKDFELFDAILGKNRVSEIIQIRSLILKQPALSELSTDQNIFLSLYPNKADSLDLLWTIAINNKISDRDIYQVMHQSSEELVAKDTLLSNQPVLAITIKPLSKIFYVFLENGLVAGSFSKFVMEKFLNKTTAKISKDFIAQINSADKKNEDSPFNIFINHHSAFSFATNLFRNKPEGIFTLLKDLSGSSILNMNFKSDALMFNGSSQTDTASATYLNAFLYQNPVPVSIKNVFPASTSNYIAFGLSDYKIFHSRLRQLFQKRKELTRLTAQINRVKEKYTLNLDNEIGRIRIKEFAAIQLAGNEKMVIISVNDGLQLKSLFESLSPVSTGNVKRFNDSNILYYYLGDPLKPYSRPYFSVIDNYAVIANDAGTVQKFLDDYKSGYFLYSTTGFAEFNQLVASQSNIQFFINNKNSSYIFINSLKRNYARAFTDENYGYKNFYGLSLQLSADRDHFFDNLYAEYTSPGANKLELVWKYRLNSRLSLIPQVISGFNDKKLVLVQDNVNNLYVLSEDGKKLWSIQLPDKIEGTVHQLKDNSLVFNTKNLVYRFEISGIMSKGFPVKLSKTASYGLTVTSIDPANLKIFIPCSDQIIAIDASGTAIKEWPRSLSGRILFDLKTAVLNNTNYLIAGTENGQFYFFNYNGNLAGKAEDPVANSYRNSLSLDIKSDMKDSRIVTTDTSGTIKSIFFNGKISSENIGVWSGNHFFDMRNISGEITPELIYVYKNQLYVYNADSTLLYNYDFGGSIINRPQFFQLNQSDYQIGVSSSRDDLLYLFADDGSLERGFPVKGIAGFYTGNFISNGFKYLICGDKSGFLYVYKLE